MAPKCTEELDKIYIAVTHILQSLIDLLINKCEQNIFIHNIVDLPYFQLHTPPFLNKL